MYPTFTLGGWTVHTYYVLYVLGGIVGGVAGWFLARRMKVPALHLIIYYAVLFPLAIGAGMLNGLLFSRDFYLTLRYGGLIPEGGIITYGVILMAYAVTAVFARIYHTRASVDLDILARVLPIMLVVFRIGCLLNGCCYGRPVDGFGGVYLPNIYGEWTQRYPTQLLLLGLDLLLAAGLWLYGRRDPSPGSLAVALIFWFGVGRILIDPLRELPAVLGPFSLHVLADLAFLLAGAGLMLWRRIRQAPAPPVKE